MKKCPNCGAEMEEQNNFCPQCGSRCDNGQVPESPAYQPSEGYSGDGTELYPMKWHKFLMVVMIIGAVLTAISGISTMAGLQYRSEGLEASYVYAVFPGLKSCDMVYGIVLIALSVFQIITRNRLKEFRANGPYSLRLLYILSIAVNVIYLAWGSSVTSVNLFTSANLGNIAGSVILLLINNSYYNKRRELFVN